MASTGPQPHIWRRTLLAALVYFGLAFALGFALGVVRTLTLAAAPGIGRLAAVAVEIPIMLAGCWGICGAVVRRMNVPVGWRPRLAMGTTAFIVLQTAEVLLGEIMLGRSLTAQVAAFAEPAGALGLAGQIGFAVLPLFVGRADGSG